MDILQNPLKHSIFSVLRVLIYCLFRLDEMLSIFFDLFLFHPTFFYQHGIKILSTRKSQSFQQGCKQGFISTVFSAFSPENVENYVENV